MMSIVKLRVALSTMLILLIGLIWIGIAFPIRAQGPFATNTPQPAPRSFATNTPELIPTSRPIATNTLEPSATPIGPAAGMSQYALRLWLERDVLEILLEQIAQIQADDIDSLRSVQLVQYELDFRFPGAPRNIEDRARLVNAMINAPIGTVDMKSTIRPYIEHAVNQGLVVDNQFEGFVVDMIPANLNSGDVVDAVIHIVYPDPVIDAIRYEDYVLAISDGNGTYTFVPDDITLPVVPYNRVTSMTLNRIEDVNLDGVDEVALMVDDGDINQHLLVLGYRNGVALDLTRPSETIRLGRLVKWDTTADVASSVPPVIDTRLFQLESSRWGCISEIPVKWLYEGNFYRPSIAQTDRFENIDSFACQMHQAEPIFAMQPAAAIEFITNQLVNYGSDVERPDRAVMTLAMLYALDGKVSLAQDTAIGAQASSNDIESWVGQQSELFLLMINEPSNTAFDVCVALAETSLGEDGACDVKAVLGRVFESATLPADVPIITQLENIGLTVEESLVISEVGRADRTAVYFGYESAGWWTFVARDDVYHAEQIDTPPQFEALPETPTLIRIPQTAYAELFSDNDPAGVLNIIETTRVAYPNIPFSNGFRYLEALSNDLLARREVARQAYFSLWNDDPQGLWGKLAGKHLELR